MASSECQLTGFDRLIDCDRCHNWFCDKCQDVDQAFIDALKLLATSYHEQAPEWYCKACKQPALTAVQAEWTIEERCAAYLDTKFRELDTRLTTVETEIKEKPSKAAFLQLSKKVEEIAKQPATNQPEITTARIAEMVREEIEEREDIRSRRMNIMIQGLTESTEGQGDSDAASKLIKDVMDIEVTPVRVQRMGLGANANHPRTLQVTLPETKKKHDILAKATQLRTQASTDGVDYSKIYIRPDLTRRQREQSKNLLGELHKVRAEFPGRRFRIKQNQVIEEK